MHLKAGFSFIACWALGAALAQAPADSPASAAAPPPPAAQAGPAPIAHPTVAAALAALQARDGNGAVVAHSDGWVIVNEPAAAAQWSFVPAGHPAYPAVVRRVIQRPPGQPVAVQVQGLCEGPEAACSQLLQDFNALNDRIGQALRARARQGSTQPR